MRATALTNLSSPECAPDLSTASSLHSFLVKGMQIHAITCAQGVDALILVAPAVVAFGFLTPSGSGRAGRVRRDGSSCSVAFTAKEPHSPPVQNGKR